MILCSTWDWNHLSGVLNDTISFKLYISDISSLYTPFKKVLHRNSNNFFNSDLGKVWNRRSGTEAENLKTFKLSFFLFSPFILKIGRGQLSECNQLSVWFCVRRSQYMCNLILLFKVVSFVMPSENRIEIHINITNIRIYTRIFK